MLGADFVRGRVCQGPSLLAAEMSRNPLIINLVSLVNLHKICHNLLKNISLV